MAMNNLTIIFQMNIPFGQFKSFFSWINFYSVSFKNWDKALQEKLQSDIMDPKFWFSSELLTQKCENSMVGFRGACGIYLGFSETRKTDNVVLLVVKIPTLCVNLPHSSVSTTINGVERISMFFLFLDACTP